MQCPTTVRIVCAWEEPLLCRLAFYKWKMRRRKSCLTQQQLVEAYEGPNFELSDRYGEVCSHQSHPNQHNPRHLATRCISTDHALLRLSIRKCVALHSTSDHSEQPYAALLHAQAYAHDASVLHASDQACVSLHQSTLSVFKGDQLTCCSGHCTELQHVVHAAASK